MKTYGQAIESMQAVLKAQGIEGPYDLCVTPEQARQILSEGRRFPEDVRINVMAGNPKLEVGYVNG